MKRGAGRIIPKLILDPLPPTMDATPLKLRHGLTVARRSIKPQRRQAVVTATYSTNIQASEHRWPPNATVQPPQTPPLAGSVAPSLDLPVSPTSSTPVPRNRAHSSILVCWDMQRSVANDCKRREEWRGWRSMALFRLHGRDLSREGQRSTSMYHGRRRSPRWLGAWGEAGRGRGADARAGRLL
jgi:hypothetical protein